MTAKAKRFRIGVEGATTDGREIQREWLEQMAASYNPAVYTALINLEHIKSYLPDSTFNRYGKVTALFAEEITEGPLAGKMALYADVEPTESLVELVKKGQKLFTSMEVSPKFADKPQAESRQSFYRCRGNGDRTGRNPGGQAVPVCPCHGAVYQKRAVR